MPLLDHLGRPIQASELSDEIATPSVAHVRDVWHQAVAPGLTPYQLGSILAKIREQDGQGSAADEYLTLAEEIEERDLHYRSVLHVRKTAVKRLPLKVVCHTEDAKEEKMADDLRERLADCDMGEVVFDLLDGLGKGYSGIEMDWQYSKTAWWPRFHWRDPHMFQYDRETGTEIRLRDESDMVNGIPLVPGKFLVHEPLLKTGIPLRRGLALPMAFAHMCKSYTIKDWQAFLEVYGIPLRVGKYAVGASKADISRLRTAISNLATDAGAVLPATMDIEFPSNQVRNGKNAHKENADYWDEQTSKLVLGQTMTADNGSSLAQAKIHNEVRQDIRDDDAKQVAATLSNQFVRVWQQLNYGPQKRYLRIVIEEEEQEDTEKFVGNACELADRGVPIEVSQVLDRMNLTEPADGAAIMHPKGKAPAEGQPDDDDDKTPPTPGEPDNGQEGEDDDKARNRATALNTKRYEDAIDELVDMGLRDWERQTDPIMQPIFEAANEATSYEDLDRAIAKLATTIDTKTLVGRLATQMFMARGLGDATDDV
jgi:phage gp29-like protein